MRDMHGGGGVFLFFYTNYKFPPSYLFYLTFTFHVSLGTLNLNLLRYPSSSSSNSFSNSFSNFYNLPGSGSGSGSGSGFGLTAAQGVTRNSTSRRVGQKQKQNLDDTMIINIGHYMDGWRYSMSMSIIFLRFLLFPPPFPSF